MLIGLTGKTGSGKSSAAKIFRSLGAYVADCDEIAHKVLSDDNVKDEILREFSSVCFSADGNVDRKKLGSIVFSDKEKLLKLNHIMHAAIIEKVLLQCQNSKKDICVIDGSEIESSGLYKKCSYVVVITADENVRLKRIMTRDSISKEDALMRMRAQADYSHKAFFVANNGSVDELEKEITILYNKFLGELNDTF